MDLTEKELKQLADSLNTVYKLLDTEVSKETGNDFFESLWNYEVKEIGSKTVKDIARVFFEAGRRHSGSAEEDIPFEVVEDIVDRNLLLDNIQEWLKNANNNKDTKVEVSDKYIKLTRKCNEANNCIAFPDRCPAVENGSDECSIVLTVKRFNEMIGIKDE